MPPRPSAPLRTYVPPPKLGALLPRKEPAPVVKPVLLASEANLLLTGRTGCTDKKPGSRILCWNHALPMPLQSNHCSKDLHVSRSHVLPHGKFLRGAGPHPSASCPLAKQSAPGHRTSAGTLPATCCAAAGLARCSAVASCPSCHWCAAQTSN